MLEIISDKGERRFFGSALNIAGHTRLGIIRALHKSGQGLIYSLQNEANNGLKTGKFYKVKVNGIAKIHQASAPGETPATITGRYANAGRLVIRPKELVFKNIAPYSGYLEFGTTRMKPRPGLSNAIVDQERNIVRNFLKEIEREI